MKKLFFTVIATLIATPAFAQTPEDGQEVNPFTGSHGKVEQLRLEIEETKQRNELLREKAELRENQFKLDTLDSDMEVKRLEAQAKVQMVLNPPAKEPEPAPVVVAPPPPPKPKPKLQLVGVIETDAGRQAILKKGEKTWTVSQGSKVEKLTVKSVQADQVKLSNKQTLVLTQGEHPLSTGEKDKIEAGGVSDEMAQIMGITAPQKSTLPRRISPTPARF